MLASLVGAGAIVNTLALSDGVSALLFVVLAALGMAVQAWQFNLPKRTTARTTRTSAQRHLIDKAHSGD